MSANARGTDCERREISDLTLPARRRLGQCMLWRLLIGAAVLLFLLMWFRAVLDLFRRPDVSAVGKIAWALGMLVVPFLGLAVYMMLRPADSQIARRRRA